jgi:LacI family transcriptional regulator
MVQGTPTLADVARAAGVHKATASRALNPHTRGQVNAATASRVQAAARKLGYVPNSVARGLRTRRTAAVGVLVPDLANPLFPPIVRGIEDRLASDGYATLIASTDSDDDRERTQLAALEARQVEGFIVATARRSHPLFGDAAARGVPLVFVNRLVDGLAAPSVTADDAVGVASAVAHLVELEHRRIGYLAGPQDMSPGSIRLAAFRQAVSGTVVECAAYTEAAGLAGGRRLLAENPDVTGVLGGNDLIALGALEALAEAGLRCPADVSVIGFNDMPFADRIGPGLTTVRIPHHDMGVQAAELLMERIREPAVVAKKLLLPVSLVVRGSTAAAR